MEIYDAWEPGSEPNVGPKLCFDQSESWELAERRISDQMWAGHYSALRVEPDVLCARGHFLEIGSMVEEGWDWHNELIVLGCINGSYPDIYLQTLIR